MVEYEQLLNRDVWWALKEGSMHFEKESAVHKTLQKIAHRLDELGVSYALAGAMAMFFHGYRRFTEDVDLLVTREGGYTPLGGSNPWRDPPNSARKTATG